MGAFAKSLIRRCDVREWRPLSLVVLLGVSVLAAAPVGAADHLDAPTVLSLTTGDFEVPPGEMLECFFTDVIADRELSVIGASSHQGSAGGGHHLAVYYTDALRKPGHRPCTDGDMVEHFVVGAVGHQSFMLPKGLSVKVPRNTQLILQSHYVNTTGAALRTDDRIDLHLADPGHPTVPMQMFLIVDMAFEIPAKSGYSSVMLCAVPRDLRIIQIKGHMHDLGARFRLEIVDASGQVRQTLYDEPWIPAWKFTPPSRTYPLEHPLVLSAGTLLRQTCQWENPNDRPIRYPQEMCSGILSYSPGEGEFACSRR